MTEITQTVSVVPGVLSRRWPHHPLWGPMNSTLVVYPHIAPVWGGRPHSIAMAPDFVGWFVRGEELFLISGNEVLVLDARFPLFVYHRSGGRPLISEYEGSIGWETLIGRLRQDKEFRKACRVPRPQVHVLDVVSR